MITIRKPLCFSEIGKKDNQEDYLFPRHADENNRVFIMCDGMGGHDNGEIASKTAATALGDFLMSCSQVDIPTFEVGLRKAYDALDGIDTDSAKKPGTTMTCLCLNEDSYLVAHIGDSRIYHIRPSLYNAETGRGGILYQSSDHSLVNDLLKAGELTEEEARDFPQKNIITRAMQPHLEKRYKADVYCFDDIQTGDYFFLCCDGVLEQLSNEDLCRILSDRKSDDAQKLAQIKEICDGKTRDNYTCWLIPVDKVKITADSSTSTIIRADSEQPESSDTQPSTVNRSATAATPEKKFISVKIPLPNIRFKPSGISRKVIYWSVAILVILAAICSAIYTFNRLKQQKVSPKPKVESTIDHDSSRPKVESPFNRDRIKQDKLHHSEESVKPKEESTVNHDSEIQTDDPKPEDGNNRRDAKPKTSCYVYDS